MTRTLPALALTLVAILVLTPVASATGVGGATWTPDRSTTTASDSRFLVDGDSITIRTDAVWDRAQAEGLEAYLATGLRYTHEVNDRSGRLSATGYWATNHPDPAYDRDDDDGDGRWEEAEVIAGDVVPEVGRTYTSLVQFSRWHPKRTKRRCDWAWDRRRGSSEVLAQLSRGLLGEWQAVRYTLGYDTVEYPRVGTRPQIPAASVRARCRDPRPGVNQQGYVVTFARPIRWARTMDLVSAGSGTWIAFEAVGTHPDDELTWTCGGPVQGRLKLRPCRRMGVRVQGMSAAVGFFDELAAGQLRDHPAVAAVEPLRDSLTGLLYDVGGFGIEPPGLTVDDRYWELVLAD